MPYYSIYLVCLIIEFIIGIYTYCIDEPKKKNFGKVAMLSVLVVAVGSFATTDIPKPEIYTTNGDSLSDNEIYIKSEWPLKVVYSLKPYEDPKQNGVRFDKNIVIAETMTVSAKATIFGIKWSELESRDIVVGNDSLDIIDTDTPGTSIKKINACLTGERYFPGDALMSDALKVEGETIAGENVIIEDFDFIPEIFKEGKNEIFISYKNLSCKLIQYVSPPALIGIKAEYIGDELHVEDKLKKSNFKVVGLYENGKEKALEDFEINPNKLENVGETVVCIKVEDFEEEVKLKVKEKEYAFTYVSELHTPNGAYDPRVNVSNWDEDEDYSIDGKTFKKGVKVKFDNWVSGMMGNGADFETDVESKLYFSVNQKKLAKYPKNERYFDGHFVIGRETNGSTTTAKIKILIDDKVVYETDTINAASTNIPAFHIPANGVEQIVIQTNANVCGNAFVLGVVFD